MKGTGADQRQRPSKSEIIRVCMLLVTSNGRSSDHFPFEPRVLAGTNLRNCKDFGFEIEHTYMLQCFKQIQNPTRNFCDV